MTYPYGGASVKTKPLVKLKREGKSCLAQLVESENLIQLSAIGNDEGNAVEKQTLFGSKVL